VGKTGFNSAAGWCVASIVKLTTGRRVAVVVLGSRSKHLRFRDAKKAMKYLEAQSAQQASGR
jgi:D-alanyl-D-alanine carboxypeptidase